MFNLLASDPYFFRGFEYLDPGPQSCWIRISGGLNYDPDPHLKMHKLYYCDPEHSDVPKKTKLRFRFRLNKKQCLLMLYILDPDLDF